MWADKALLAALSLQEAGVIQIDSPYSEAISTIWFMYFLRGSLRLKSSETLWTSILALLSSLHVFASQRHSPNPESKLQDLIEFYNCFLKQSSKAEFSHTVGCGMA